jgi:hypothetical protein
MSSAARSAGRFDRASEGSLVGAPGGARRRQPASSTAPRRVSDLSTKVEDCPFLVENRVDAAHRRAYLPTSAPLLRPVDG